MIGTIVGGLGQIVRGLLRIALSPSRIVTGPLGCLISALLGPLLLFAILFAVVYFAGFRHVGPRLDGDRFTVRGSHGVERTVDLSPAAANLFDLKVTRAERSTSDGLVTVVFSEAEINAKLRALLDLERAADDDFPIDSVIVVFTPDRATFFINGGALGRTVGVEARVRLTIGADGRLDLEVERITLGSLPSLPFSRQIANLVLDALPLDDELEQALPGGAVDVRIEEGQLTIEVDPARIARDGR